MSFYFSTGTMHVWYGNIEPIDFGATDSQPPLHWLVPLTHNLCYTDAYIPANLVAPDPYIYLPIYHNFEVRENTIVKY